MVTADIGARRVPATTYPKHDAGFSFVETVVTIVLLGVVVVPVLAAVRGAIRASSTSKASAQVETVLLNAVDRVQRASNGDPDGPDPTDGCDFTGAAQGAAAAIGWPAEQVEVRQEQFGVAGWEPDPPLEGACVNVAKRITITVTSPGDEVSRTIQVVKTDD